MHSGVRSQPILSISVTGAKQLSSAKSRPLRDETKDASDPLICPKVRTLKAPVISVRRLRKKTVGDSVFMPYDYLI